MEKSNELSDVKVNGGPLQRLKGSVGKYELPFEPVGVDDWDLETMRWKSLFQPLTQMMRVSQDRPSLHMPYQ
ncbi:hypothetical protein [Vreelandella titanicae]|uniref:hypothetical protein n=1 Tax=Vreelandella titanicae TaxID=664683 RepID=UPI0039BEDE64